MKTHFPYQPLYTNDSTPEQVEASRQRRAEADRINRTTPRVMDMTTGELSVWPELKKPEESQ